MKTLYIFAVVLSLCSINLTITGCHGKVDTDRTEFALDEVESIDVAVVKTSENENDFKKKMKALSGNKITEEVVAKARKAYIKLPPEMKKAEDDTKIKAYEALVPTKNASQIKSALNQYSNQYTLKQRNALQKISNQMGYDKYLKEAIAQAKHCIDIQLINEILKDK